LRKGNKHIKVNPQQNGSEGSKNKKTAPATIISRLIAPTTALI
jgi:hypothetical protein